MGSQAIELTEGTSPVKKTEEVSTRVEDRSEALSETLQNVNYLYLEDVLNTCTNIAL